MDKKELMFSYHTYSKNKFWSEQVVVDKLTPELKEHIENVNGFKFLSLEEMEVLRLRLVEFDINLVWERSFWGIGKDESIYFLASDVSRFLSNLRSESFELGVKRLRDLVGKLDVMDNFYKGELCS